MDHKSWLWKKRSTEKTLAADKTNNSTKRNEESATEVRDVKTEKAELERDIRLLHDELSSVISECNNKDNVMKKQIKIAQEAIEGWEKARKEATSLKKDLDKALQQKIADEERLSQLDAALKECMKQLCFVRDEQEKRIHDAVVKTSEEYEKKQTTLEAKMSEISKSVGKLDGENAQLKKSLLEKDKVIEELNRQRSQREAEFNALMLRLQSSEKESASLKYEVRVLEKEIEIRTEEREFYQRTDGVARKQQQESAKKIANLESECQKLRLLVKKRLPGAADLAKMKKEVEILGKNQAETRRRRSNPSSINSMDFQPGTDTTSRKIDFLMEQLHMIEEENKSLKYDLEKKSNEIQSYRTLYPHKSSWLTQGEGQAENSLKGLTNREQHSYLFNVRNDDEVSCAESWASALISELENFKNEKELATPSRGNISTSDINLMDDFTEMEKLAIVSVDYTAESSRLSSDEGNSTIVASLDRISNTKKNAQTLQKNVSESIHKILELLVGIKIASQEDTASDVLMGKDYKNCSDSRMGYLVRVFQWKAAEISKVLQQLVQTCNNLLKGTGDLEQFAQVVASSLDWIMNHCFSIQDVSSMKDTIISRLDWDEWISESEPHPGLANHSAEYNNRVNLPHISMVSPLSSHNTKEYDENNEKENKESSFMNLEGRNESQIESLRSRMKSMRYYTGDQTENHTIIKDDFETHHSKTNLEPKAVSEDISNLENEENRSNSSKIMEETCDYPSIQSMSMTREDADDGKDNVKELQNQDWEINAASEKLAECQETLRNLGIQLKSLASPREAGFSDKVIPTPAEPIITWTPERHVSQRFSLLDKLTKEEDDKLNISLLIHDETQNGKMDSTLRSDAVIESLNMFTASDVIDGDSEKVATTSLAIVPLKKKNGTASLLKKLFRRKKSSSIRKTLFS